MKSDPFQKPAKSRVNQIFANNDVDMSKIKAIGFDYDYTLCHYTTELQKYIYIQAREYLVDELGYPTIIKGQAYSTDFPIRSLMFDTKTGLLFKLDYLLNISLNCCYRGKIQVPKEEIFDIYNGTRHLSESYLKHNLKCMNDLFSLAKACLLADIIGHFENERFSNTSTSNGDYTNYDPLMLYEDVSKAIDKVHIYDLQKEIADHVEEYITPSPKLGDVLKKFKDYNKQLFLLTNSPLPNIEIGLRYLLGNNWKEYFDYIIVSSRKPNFFTDHTPFRRMDEMGVVYWDKVGKLEKKIVYSHGNFEELAKMAGWGKRGNRVLYFGDSISSDLAEPTRRYGITTGAIIRELEDEIKIEQSPEFLKKVCELESLDELKRRIQYKSDLSPSETQAVKRLSNEAKAIRKYLSEIKNEYFGSLFRSENNPTLFALDTLRYADLYTSRLENFADYPPDCKFHPAHMSLPHEPFGQFLFKSYADKEDYKKIKTKDLPALDEDNIF